MGKPVTHILFDFFGTLVAYDRHATPVAERCARYLTSIHPMVPALVKELSGRFRLGVEPSQAAFVGDTYDADFVGPQAHGMYAFLIDPDDRYADVPPQQRLRTIDELPARLMRSARLA